MRLKYHSAARGEIQKKQAASKVITRDLAVQRTEIPPVIRHITDVDVINGGLSFVGFTGIQIGKVCFNTNLKRFKRFFGPDPTTIAPILNDLREKHPSIAPKDAMMTFNWLWNKDNWVVLGKTWKHCDKVVGRRVWDMISKIAAMKKEKIQMKFSHKKNHVASFDCCDFLCNEMRHDPSDQWFSFKSHSCGLVS